MEVSQVVAPAGHFSIVHSPHVRWDTMLIDTATRETWLWVSQNGDTSGDASEKELAYGKKWRG
ncbi:MAG: hypothetical protein FJX31_09025 [Alphaproteobacteria bacterium]|nr:hypothetical protein [Alphaproteobacteria bacterium]